MIKSNVNLAVIVLFLNLLTSCTQEENYPPGVNFHKTELAFESIGWSPDSEKLVGTTAPLPRSGFNTGLPASEVYIWQLASDTFEQISDEAYSRWNANAVWRPQGDQILYYSQSEFGEETRIGMVNIDSKVKESVLSFGLFAAWFPNGQSLAVDNGDVFIFDITTKTHQKIWSPHKDQLIHSLAVSPDGLQIAVITEEVNQPTNRIFLIGSDGNNEKLMLEASGHLDRLDWSPNGHWITFIDAVSNDIVAIQLASNCATDPLGIEAITNSNVRVKDIRWSPNGQLIAVNAIKENQAGVFFFETTSELVKGWLRPVSCN